MIIDLDLEARSSKFKCFHFWEKFQQLSCMYDDRKKMKGASLYASLVLALENYYIQHKGSKETSAASNEVILEVASLIDQFKDLSMEELGNLCQLLVDPMQESNYNLLVFMSSMETSTSKGRIAVCSFLEALVPFLTLQELIRPVLAYFLPILIVRFYILKILSNSRLLEEGQFEVPTVDPHLLAEELEVVCNLLLEIYKLELFLRQDNPSSSCHSLRVPDMKLPNAFDNFTQLPVARQHEFPFSIRSTRLILASSSSLNSHQLSSTIADSYDQAQVYEFIIFLLRFAVNVIDCWHYSSYYLFLAFCYHILTSKTPLTDLSQYPINPDFFSIVKKLFEPRDNDPSSRVTLLDYLTLGLDFKQIHLKSDDWIFLITPLRFIHGKRFDAALSGMASSLLQLLGHRAYLDNITDLVLATLPYKD